MDRPIVVVGAGQAAASFISRHVTLGSGTPLLLIGEESVPPYHRPPLSKKYMSGELERERLFIRPEQWYPDQGNLVARVLADEQVVYDAIPWFWSDQYDCKLQIAGLNIGYDQTVHRPGAKPEGQSIWYYSKNRLSAVDAMNDPLAYAMGRKIIGTGLNPAPKQIADPRVDLKSLVK